MPDEDGGLDWLELEAEASPMMRPRRARLVDCALVQQHWSTAEGKYVDEAHPIARRGAVCRKDGLDSLTRSA